MLANAMRKFENARRIRTPFAQNEESTEKASPPAIATTESKSLN